MNIILEKIKPYIEKITGDNQNGVRVGGYVICTENLGKHSEYNIYLLIFKRLMTLYIETHYGNVWKNLKFLKN